MKTGIIAFAIAVVLLMTTVQTVAATAFTAVGHVEFENGTAVPYGWTVEIWNLDEEYGAEPWTDVTKWVPISYEYGKTCEYENADNYIHVRVTSTDGTYVGENISRWGDVYIGPSEKTRMNVTVLYQAPPTENFTKSLPLGWNLISLSLTPTDNSAISVLGYDTIEYDAVKQYNANTKMFEDATTMDPGTGYFVHVTTAGTWEYEGTAYTSISTPLSQGLNCVGWTNETGSALPGALSSIDGSYRYVARWNAGTQSYEVYLPGAPAVFNDFTTMDRGEGYFIAATEGCTLAYPSSP